MGCCASKAFEPEPGSATSAGVSDHDKRVAQQLEPATPACNAQSPEHSLQYAGPDAGPFRDDRCPQSPRLRRLPLEQRLLQQQSCPTKVATCPSEVTLQFEQQSCPTKATFVPSQAPPGRHLSIDQRLQNPQPKFVPSQGQRQSLDHLLHERGVAQSLTRGQECVAPPRYPYAYPSQGRRQSLDQRMQSAPNDFIPRSSQKHIGAKVPDPRDPPSSQPRSRAKARSKGATTPRQKGGRSKQQVKHAYLNLDPECARALSSQAHRTGLLSPGKQFSLRGRLVKTPTRANGDDGERRQRGTRVQQFVLAPEDGHQYLTWRKQRGQLEPLQPPSKISRDLFEGPMGSTVSTEMMGFVHLSLTSDSAKNAVGVSSTPKFPCINTPSLEEAEGTIRLSRWKGEGLGFDYLRTSRDC